MADKQPEITVGDIDSAPTRLPEAEDKTYSSDDFDKLLNRVDELATDNQELRDLNGTLRNRKEAAEELNKLIGPYASKAFYFMCCYSTVVGAFVFASGATFWGLDGFKLDTSVLEFLVGSTAVTVVSLVGMVLTGIFVGARK
ncbi:hypothetical protein [uncultured Roseobacter sp.]|uniref:hypothetical protein n=1 Tax=uncultured Roseobacter sp. TaxID=114847 RepID=UPI00262D1F2A|nr:hypothetical protein [uncultured Roseobacter sp.]